MIPTPHACGLPEKFSAWRPAQEDALRRLLATPTRVKALSAPTGFGKTPVYVAWALLSKQPTCFVTESRALQDQLLKDFESIGMVDLRGRANYPCETREEWSCQEGYAAKCSFKGSALCPASAAEYRAMLSDLIVTNYDKWTSSKRFGRGLAHVTQVVFDEGHLAPDALFRAMQVALHAHELGDIGVSFLPPRKAEEMVDWVRWAQRARATADDKMKAVVSHMSASPTRRSTLVHQLLHLQQLTRRLSILAAARPEDWVVDELKDGYVFDPIRAGRYSEGALLVRVPSILLVSATLRPKTLFQLGLPKTEYLFIEYPSDFDPSRCPIYYLPVMRVDVRARSLAPLWACLDQIISRRQDRKGIVHTVSYARRDEVTATSRFIDRMLINERGEAATDTIEDFKKSQPGTILVSPSVGAGFDFPGRECEWQFVCKIPFPDGRSKIHQARQSADPEYGAHQAITKLVQIFGRGMRSAEDRCENFIGDAHLDWFLPRYGHLAPQSFARFFRRIAVLPPPPPRV